MCSHSEALLRFIFMSGAKLSKAIRYKFSDIIFIEAYFTHSKSFKM